MPASSHSDYVNTLLSLGWVGFVCFTTVLSLALVRAWALQRRASGPGALAGLLLLCALMTAMVVEVIMFQTTIPSLIALVLLLRLAFGEDIAVPREHIP